MSGKAKHFHIVEVVLLKEEGLNFHLKQACYIRIFISDNNKEHERALWKKYIDGKIIQNVREQFRTRVGLQALVGNYSLTKDSSKPNNGSVDVKAALRVKLI